MEKSSLQLNTSTGNYLIDTRTIIRVQASSNYSKLFLSNGKVLVTAKLLKWFEEHLPDQSFTRLHRSHLVNNLFLNYHQRINKCVELIDGNFIQISRRRRKSVHTKFLSFLLLVFLLQSTSYAQSVGIGTISPHASAQLDVNSTTKGTLITTMTTAQRRAILNPAAGLLVFDIDKKTIYMFDGLRWLPFLFSITEKNPATPLKPLLNSVDGNIGYRVAIHGDYAIVGAYTSNSPAGLGTGLAYIFFQEGGVWKQQDLLIANDTEADDFFGGSVAINESFAVVGAWGDDIGSDLNQGSVYIFSRNGTNWTQQSKITAADGVDNDFFGYSVDINADNFLIIGAYGDDNGGNINQGGAYIYKGTAGLGGFIWTLQAKLTASDGAFGDNFGAAVSISGSYALVGAYGDDVGANTDQGSVYSFYEFTNLAGWTTGQAYHQKLVAADGDAFDYFGISISQSSSQAVIGASGDDVGANSDQGSVYTFTQTGGIPFLWSFPHKILAPDGAANDNFGISVALSASRFAVGAYRADANGVTNAGAVYLFDDLFFSFVPSYLRKLNDDDGQVNGNFGFSVGMAGYNILIGAKGKNNNMGQVLIINIE